MFSIEFMIPDDQESNTWFPFNSNGLLPKSVLEHMKQNIGVYLVMLSQFFNCVMILLCKLILTDPSTNTPLHPLQILFIRMVITYIGCILYFTWWEKDSHFPFGPKGIRLLLLSRGVGGFIGVGFQYWSLMYLDLSDTVCITFLAPTMTSLFASVLLREKFTRPEMLGGFIAFAGVVLIAQPVFLFGGVAESSSKGQLIGSIFAFVSTIGTAVAMCSIRKIGFRSHPLFTVSIYALTTIILSSIGIALLPDIEFRMPSNLSQWVYLTLIGFTGFFMQFLLTAGMQREKASRAIAMNYTQLLYASVFDWIFFNKLPHGLAAFGEIIIVSAVVIIIYFKESDPNIQNGTNPSTGSISLEEGVNSIELGDITKKSSTPAANSIITDDGRLESFDSDDFDIDNDSLRV